jgi:hypothetical protein
MNPRTRLLIATTALVAVVFVGGVLPVLASSHREALILHVDFVEGNPAGISVGDEFRGTFEADESVLLMPDGVHDGRFVDFELTIGPVNWNESHGTSTSPPQFLISGGALVGVEVSYTETLPAHPNLTTTQPSSPGTWRVDDEDDLIGQPIYGGNFGGTYTLEFIPEAVPALGGRWPVVVVMLVLTIGVVYRVIRTRSASSGSG